MDVSFRSFRSSPWLRSTRRACTASSSTGTARSSGWASSPRDLADRRKERLLGGLRSDPRLAVLAESPLLLTMLAKVNQEKDLPESRADLYKECVDQLLWNWEGAKHDLPAAVSKEEEPETLLGLIAEAGTKKIDFERALWEKTYDLHGSKGEAELDDFTRAELEPALRDLYRGGPQQASLWAERVLDLMERRSGLLVAAVSGVFNYPHRSFQEYMAARWLGTLGKAADQAREKAGDPGWAEVIRLACGHLASDGNYGSAAAVALEVCGTPEETEDGSNARAMLAAEAWRDCRAGWPEQRGEDGGAVQGLRAALDARLTRWMQDTRSEPKKRLRAGLMLADLEILPPDLDDLVTLDGGELGIFELGKYPVTNHQFDHFVAAGGYREDAPWWDEEAKREILEYQEMYLDGSWPAGPRYREHSRIGGATLPVVGVSWYEVKAYCAWLTMVWREEGKITADQEVRLPSEVEWAEAAAGSSGREFPWGDAPDPTRLNDPESDLDAPTPVHMYPAGASPEGVFDLAGNVWEWTRTVRAKGSSARVLAGGAWHRIFGNAGSSARYRLYPGFRDYDLGFRVCVVPSSRATPES